MFAQKGDDRNFLSGSDSSLDLRWLDRLRRFHKEKNPAPLDSPYTTYCEYGREARITSDSWQALMVPLKRKKQVLGPQRTACWKTCQKMIKIITVPEGGIPTLILCRPSSLAKDLMSHPWVEHVGIYTSSGWSGRTTLQKKKDFRDTYWLSFIFAEVRKKDSFLKISANVSLWK